LGLFQAGGLNFYLTADLESSLLLPTTAATFRRSGFYGLGDYRAVWGSVGQEQAMAPTGQPTPSPRFGWRCDAFERHNLPPRDGHYPRTCTSRATTTVTAWQPTDGPRPPGPYGAHLLKTTTTWTDCGGDFQCL